MTKFAKGIADHKVAVHGGAGHVGKCEGTRQDWPLKDIQGTFDKSCVVCREEQFVKNLSYSTCSLVCKDCFGSQS